MTHVLELPPDLEARVKRLVAERGLSLNEFFVDAVEQAARDAAAPQAAEESEEQRFEHIHAELTAYAAKMTEGMNLDRPPLPDHAMSRAGIYEE